MHFKLEKISAEKTRDYVLLQHSLHYRFITHVLPAFKVLFDSYRFDWIKKKKEKQKANYGTAPIPVFLKHTSIHTL